MFPQEPAKGAEVGWEELKNHVKLENFINPHEIDGNLTDWSKAPGQVAESQVERQFFNQGSLAWRHMVFETRGRYRRHRVSSHMKEHMGAEQTLNLDTIDIWRRAVLCGGYGLPCALWDFRGHLWFYLPAVSSAPITKNVPSSCQISPGVPNATISSPPLTPQRNTHLCHSHLSGWDIVDEFLEGPPANTWDWITPRYFPSQPLGLAVYIQMPALSITGFLRIQHWNLEVSLLSWNDYIHKVTEHFSFQS